MNQGTGRRDAVRDPAERRRVRALRMRLARAGMIFLGGMILVVGLLLLCLPLFRVQRIDVQGNSYYTEEALIRASGLETGRELLATDLQAVVANIERNCPYVERVEVRIVFPSTVRITVVERQNVMRCEWDGIYLSVDRSFRVLEMSAEESDFSAFLRTELPPIAEARVGERIVFADATLDPAYILTLLDYLGESGLLENLTSLDVASRFDVSYVIADRCRIRLGRMDSLERKHRLAGEILAMKGELGDSSVILDVSNPEKPTYRVVDSLEQDQ